VIVYLQAGVLHKSAYIRHDRIIDTGFVTGDGIIKTGQELDQEYPPIDES
jgi:hypothetical protein